MEKEQEQKERILESTIRVFNKKGLKFTMDDVAQEAGMSKKTLYKIFREKEEMFLAMVDYMFDSIKESKEQVLHHPEWDTERKIRAILCVLPDGYKGVDFRQLYLLKEKYPQIYKQVEVRLETGWESTLELLEQGMKEGCIRRIRLPILKLMLEAALEQFFQRDVLIQNGISYTEALDEVVGILMDGIKQK